MRGGTGDGYQAERGLGRVAQAQCGQGGYDYYYEHYAYAELAEWASSAHHHSSILCLFGALHAQGVQGSMK